MSQNLEKYRYIAVLFGLLLLAGALAFQSGLAQTQPTQPEPAGGLRTITVTGMGQSSAIPDAATVRIGVRTEAATAQEALDQNSQSMQALLDILRGAGIAEQDIQTQYLQLSPRYDQPTTPSANTPVVTGYSAANLVSVRVADLQSLGDLLDQAVTAGGNTIEGISFEISDRTELYNQALEAAMSNARAKAERLAGLAGAELGEVVAISDNTAVPIPYAVGGLAATDQAVPIAPGTQDVTAHIQVTWQISGTGLIPSTGGTSTPGARVSPTATGASPTRAATTAAPTRAATTAAATSAATSAPTRAATTAVPTSAATSAATSAPTRAATTAAPTSAATSASTSAATTAPAAATYRELVRALEDSGVNVEEAGTIRQAFIPVTGQVIRANGDEVQVFEFQDAATRRSVSDVVMGASSLLATNLAGVVQQPEVWAQGRIIVFYFGNDIDLIDTMNGLLM